MVVLIVDDDASSRDFLVQALGSAHDCLEACDGEAALQILAEKLVDLVVTDLQMPKLDGLGLLNRARIAYPETEFLLMTSQATIAGAVAAMRAGALDYLLKPLNLDELDRRVKDIARRFAQSAERATQGNPTGAARLIGHSAAMKAARSFVTQAAQAQSTVLLLGRTGTGKEVMARAIHESGPRGASAFVAINCASLSDTLLESELFGHEKGAFTGALAAKPGLFELAKGGTVFLDEIGEMPVALQARLLRVLQEKEFYRVGGTRLIRTDARVICATHRDIADRVRSGAFREDLFYRLNVLRFELPRCPSGRWIWNPCSSIFGARERVFRAELTPEAKTLFLNYAYPGNVRELQNAIERTLVPPAPARAHPIDWAGSGRGRTPSSSPAWPGSSPP